MIPEHVENLLLLLLLLVMKFMDHSLPEWSQAQMPQNEYTININHKNECILLHVVSFLHDIRKRTSLPYVNANWKEMSACKHCLRA